MESRARSIVLIGMMGAGKSSIGRALHRRTGLQRFDLDELVAAKAGMSIPEIFAQRGEEFFRDLESKALADLSGSPAIVVTGGGLVLRPANRDLLKKVGIIVWLEADPATLLERATRRGHRPLLQTENPASRLADLLKERGPLYEDLADIRVDTSNLTHDQVTEIILKKLESVEKGRL